MKLRIFVDKVFLVGVVLVLSLAGSQNYLHAQHKKAAQTFKIGAHEFELNGRPFVIRCGEMHFARIPEAEWRNRLRMARAMGLNTVCAYLFWNLHEKTPGKFTWKEQSDAAKFCKIAGEEGLYVILRPGPYSCAEWDFGGFPWWLLQNKSLSLRSMDPFFLEKCRRYLMEVGRELSPLQITRGGNIIMVQVENEYGSYGNDVTYMETLKRYIQEAGFEVPLFHCDGVSQLKNDHPADLFAVVNFGSDPKSSFEALRKLQPAGPLMCGEYYPGWFDSWGRPHHTGDTERILAELRYMLDRRISFSIYMVHGGTTFGTYTGANDPNYLPQTTSYDYDAPIDEVGNPTDKFYKMRALLGQYLQTGETLPSVPDTNVIQRPGAVQFSSIAYLENNLPVPVVADTAMLMESLDQGFGAVLYKTELPAGKAALLQFKAVHDYGLIYLNDSLIGRVDRRKNKHFIALPQRNTKMTLTVLVEALGRVNYGAHMVDRKGIHGPVNLFDGSNYIPLRSWKNYGIPMGEETLQVAYQPIQSQLVKPKAAFFKGSFTVTSNLSTYLNMRRWSKGIVWINGKCLGRYWNIGPTQSMLVPGSWLERGKNEIVVFDYFGQTAPKLGFLSMPILDVLTEQQAQAHRSAGQSWKGQASGFPLPFYQGRFGNTGEEQLLSFNPVKGRYFCLEALSEWAGQPYSSLAELQLLDTDGKKIPRTAWKTLYADSEELIGGDGNADNVFDLQFTSIWHTKWAGHSDPLPHQLVLDLGAVYTIGGISVVARQDAPNGRIRDFKLYMSLKKFDGL